MEYTETVELTKSEPTKALRVLELPRYTVPEVASYVRMSPETLRTWVAGRSYPTKSGAKAAKPIIRRPRAGDPRLSYSNLVEAYVLNALRKSLDVEMKDIRSGIEYVQKEFGIERFLLSDELRARQGNLLIERLGKIYNVGQGGQAEMLEMIEKYLQRIDYQEGLPSGLYPLTRLGRPDGPKRIVILPNVGFGRPVTRYKSISTSAIVDRFEAGESVEELAEDYELDPVDIEEAIRAERLRLAA